MTGTEYSKVNTNIIPVFMDLIQLWHTQKRNHVFMGIYISNYKLQTKVFKEIEQKLCGYISVPNKSFPRSWHLRQDLQYECGQSYIYT